MPGVLNGSGVNGTAARDASKNERAYLKSPNTVRYFVANIAGEGAVVHLPVSRRQRRRESGKVKEEVVATALILSAGLVQRLKWIVDARRTGIGIGVDRIGTLIEWRVGRVRGRMRQRRVNSQIVLAQ